MFDLEVSSALAVEVQDAAARCARTVAIVADDAALRRVLAAPLRASGYEVVALCASEIGRLDDMAVDCVVGEYWLGAMDGRQFLAALASHGIAAPVIFFAKSTDVGTVVRAFQAGAVDFLEGSCAERTLIGDVARACALGADRRRDADRIDEARRTLALLTPRERETMDHLVSGKSNKVAAYAMGISTRTAEIHRTRILRKLQVTNVAGMVRLASLASAAAS